jgi:hypothetical protein
VTLIEQSSFSILASFLHRCRCCERFAVMEAANEIDQILGNLEALLGSSLTSRSFPLYIFTFVLSSPSPITTDLHSVVKSPNSMALLKSYNFNKSID